ncbi:hypothetical protein CAEBREN_24259 [Caenorhabditis brenneri]|uniref:Uncharacterized protein n=1 Tax=Caenorhabditis brenneri TaxID=135651 RepID=G0NV29_CAEBE|nr:hypothetical protein CAEBREN_24259 [Caenorhabditis brenneri]
MPKIKEPEPEGKTETADATGFTEEPIEVEEPIPAPIIKIEMPEDMKHLTAAILATMMPVEETKPDVGEGFFQDDVTGRLFYDDFEQDPIDYQGWLLSSSNGKQSTLSNIVIFIGFMELGVGMETTLTKTGGAESDNAGTEVDTDFTYYKNVVHDSQIPREILNTDDITTSPSE